MASRNPLPILLAAAVVPALALGGLVAVARAQADQPPPPPTTLIPVLPPALGAPLLSVRRYAASGGSWRPVDAHFVTVVSVPRSLGRDDGSFAVSYIDPWGGRRCEGTIRIAEQALIADKAGVSSCLEAVFPQSSVGRKKVRGNERSALAVAAALGRW